jgi:hypothetical protein
MNLAPILIFSYKRLSHLIKCIDSLKNNFLARETDVYIFSDGPKNENDIEEVDAVRRYLKGLDGFKSINVVCNNVNLGLSRSVINGIESIVGVHDYFIVVEDDLVFSEYFIQFMNNALIEYKNDDVIGCVSGYSFLSGRSNAAELFRLPSSWGWASWSAKWSLFEKNPNILVAKLNNLKLKKYFDVDGTYPSTKLLLDVSDGKYDSWAIRWDASLVLNRQLTLYPSQSLVNNIGFDSSGTHCNSGSQYLNMKLADSLPSIILDEKVEKKETVNAFIKKNKGSRIVRKLASLSYNIKSYLSSY